LRRGVTEEGEGSASGKEEASEEGAPVLAAIAGLALAIEDDEH
jgi:hypothetical protein